MGGKIKPFLADSLFVTPGVSHFFPEIVYVGAGDQWGVALSAHKENLRWAWRGADGPSQRDCGLPLVLEVSLYMNEVTSAVTSASCDRKLLGNGVHPCRGDGYSRSLTVYSLSERHGPVR